MITLAFDTETTGLDVLHECRPFFVTFAYEDGDSYRSVNYHWRVDPMTRRVVVDKSDLYKIRKRLAEADHIITQNGGFDYLAMKSVDPRFDECWDWDKVEDTMVAGHALDSSLPKNMTSLALNYLTYDMSGPEKTLDEVVKKCRNFVRTKKTLACHKWKIAYKFMPEAPSADKELHKNDMWLPYELAEFLELEENDEWRTALEEYATEDGRVTLALWSVLKDRLVRAGLYKNYRFQMRLVPIVAEMKEKGVSVSGERIRERIEEYLEEVTQARAECTSIASEYYGYELSMPNGSRNQSLERFLFDHMKLPVVKRTDKGGASIDSDALKMWSEGTEEKSHQNHFVNNLRNINSRTTAVTYMRSYERFWRQHELDENWKILHPDLGMFSTNTLRFNCKRPNEQNICVDGDTEFLTAEGWVKARELNGSHVIAQYWKGTKDIDFVKPELHRQWFKGWMQHIQTEQQIDLLLTPMHRCLVQSRKTGKYEDIPAKDFRNDVKHFHAGNYVGGDLSLSQDEVTWICAVQADGSYHTKGTYGVQFTFVKKRKADRLRRCLNNMGTKFRESTSPEGHFCFYVFTDQPAVCMAKKMLDNKKLGPWVIRCDRPTLDMLKKEIFLWDGDSTRNNTYTSSDKENTDWAQILFTLSGSRAWQRTFTPSSEWAKKDHHVVNVTLDRDYSMTTNFTKTEVPWDDWVYCVTVPSSYMVVRRNGRVSITGNSKKEGFNIRWCFGPAPGREWWSVDYANIELRIPAYGCGEKAMIDLFERPDDPPFYGSNHLLNFSIVYPDVWQQVMDEVGFERVGLVVKGEAPWKSTYYRWCKNGGFAKQYGGQKRKVDATFRRVGAFDALDGVFAGMTDKKNELIRMANRLGYIEVMPSKVIDPDRGYRLCFMKSDNGRVKPTLPFSYWVQGTAMQATRTAMWRCQELLSGWRSEGYHGFITMQVHDEMVFDLPKAADPNEDPDNSNLPYVRQLARAMELSGDDIGVPLAVSVAYNPDNWADDVPVKL